MLAAPVARQGARSAPEVAAALAASAARACAARDRRTGRAVLLCIRRDHLAAAAAQLPMHCRDRKRWDFWCEAAAWRAKAWQMLAEGEPAEARLSLRKARAAQHDALELLR